MGERRLRVAHVVAGVSEGGLSKHLADLTGEQVRMGLGVAVVGPWELLAGLGAGVEGVEIPAGGGRRDPRAVWRLGRSLAGVGPDVVHAHATKATGMALSARRWGAGPRVPVVATLHSVKKRLGVYERADRVIAVSPAAAGQIRRAAVETVLNGVRDAGSWEGALPAARGSGPLVLAVGRLVEVKGFDVLLSAWRPDDAELWIAGEGPERGRLEGLIASRGLGENVRLLGRVEGAARLMGVVDAVVIPSWREGFSYVMAEALLARRVVAATRVPGPVDVMPAGLTCGVGDGEALVSLVRGALSDREGAARLLAGAWEFARERLTVEAMAEGTLACYRRTLEWEKA